MVAQELVPELEGRIERALGPDRVRQLRDDLDVIRRAATP
jgi:hypothetical protein